MTTRLALRLVPDLRYRSRIADLLDVGPAVDEADALVLQRLVERGCELVGALYRLGPAAERAGEGGEVGVSQLGRADPFRILPLLVHADGAVAAVVRDDDEEVRAILRGGGQLLAVHQEVAVPGDAHHRAVLEAQRGGDRSGQTVAHGAAGRRELGRHGAVA